MRHTICACSNNLNSFIVISSNFNNCYLQGVYIKKVRMTSAKQRKAIVWAREALKTYWKSQCKNLKLLVQSHFLDTRNIIWTMSQNFSNGNLKKKTVNNGIAQYKSEKQFEQKMNYTTLMKESRCRPWTHFATSISTSTIWASTCA